MDKNYKLILLLFPLISFAIFFFSWPFLWENTIEHLLKISTYYKNIATGFDYQPEQYRFYGFNFYPVVWIIITTPIFTLFLTCLGIVYALVKDDKTRVNKLWLLWFFVPIFRVMLPGTSIYGGVRQIMEFLPAMALLSGMGGLALMNILKKLKFPHFPLYFVFFSVLIISLVLPIVRLHPNENVYFNSIVGGLKGAKEKNIPSWGNSYGNAYWQAVKWINSNAPIGSNVALIQGTGQNIPFVQFRPDINFSGRSWSGINRKGEYLLELTYENSRRAYPYVWDYVDRLLDPVYEVKADGVPIAKVWKNDLSNTKPEMRKDESLVSDIKKSQTENSIFFIDFGREVLLSRITLPYDDSSDCNKKGMVELSVDGENWGKEPDILGEEQVDKLLDKDKQSSGENSLNFYFPGKYAQYLKITFDSRNSCFSKASKITIYELK